MAFPGKYRTLLLVTLVPTSIGLLLAVGTLAVLKAKSCLAQDRCLDSGGSYNQDTQICVLGDAGVLPSGSTQDSNRERLMRIVGWNDAPGPSRQIAKVASCSDAGDYCCRAIVLAKRHGCLVRWDSTTILNGNESDMDLEDGSEFIDCSNRGAACGETVLCRCDELTDAGEL